MRIISNFQDIYDQCAMYGIDHDTVYRRFFNAKCEAINGDMLVMGDYMDSAREHSRWYNRQIDIHSQPIESRMNLLNLSVMFLVVGECIIPHIGGLEVRHHSRSGGDSFYAGWINDNDVEKSERVEDVRSSIGRAFVSYQDLVEALGLSVSPSHALRKAYDLRDENKLIDISRRGFLFNDVKATEELMSSFRDKRWSMALGVPLAVVIPAVVGENKPMRKDHFPSAIHGALVLRNPSIKQLGLASLMDPYTMHQEISMAMNGFLADQQDGMDNISDSDRARSKGFDEVSFKTRKGMKKPRRRRGGQ